MGIERKVRFDSGERVTRLDILSNGISKVRVTSQGFLRIPAALTRVGVLEYKRSDGSTVRELRHPDEVFKEASLATLAGAPITDDHQALIGPDNISQFGAGFVADGVSNGPRLVNGELIVQRKDTIDKVRSKKLKEISPGYTCGIDETPGVWNGERYDRKQVDIVYNHVALGPAGWGRSGPEVALRMDAAVSDTEIPADPPKQAAVKETLPMKKIRFVLDGVTYEIEVAEALAPTLEASLGKLEQERTDAKAAQAKAEGELAVSQKSVKDLETKLDAAQSPEALEKLASERAGVISKAQGVSAEIKTDGLSNVEIQKEALVASGFTRETLDAKEEAFIAGAFEALKVETKEDAGAPAFPGVTPKKQESKQDSKEEALKYDSKAARQRMVERGRNAWKPAEK